MKNILDRNQDKANEVRTLLKSRNIVMMNLISSPGAGKTSLLERTLEFLDGRIQTGIIEGDITTDRDAQRLKKFGHPIVVINTEGGCHLDSYSISRALEAFDLDDLDLIFVENVGNLICPSHFDLGENSKLAVVSTAEGDDKPAKYPMLFRDAEAVVLNKTDLIPYTNFNYEKFCADLRNINPHVPLMEVSCVTGLGLTVWYDWLLTKVGSQEKKKG